MRACNCGEKLTRTVHENAANSMAATKIRAQVCERPELFIRIGASDNGGVCASNFPGRARRVCCPEVTRRFPVAFANQLVASLGMTLDLCLEDDMTFNGSKSFCRCAGADLFRPFGVLV